MSWRATSDAPNVSSDGPRHSEHHTHDGDNRIADALKDLCSPRLILRQPTHRYEQKTVWQDESQEPIELQRRQQVALEKERPHCPLKSAERTVITRQPLPEARQDEERNAHHSLIL